MTTLKDVASRAGVSTATVSYVLNNTRFVSDELRSRVLAAVEEASYRPNRLARSLRCRRTHTVGLIVTNVINPFYTELARSAEDRAGQLGLTVVLCNSDDHAEKERRYVELLRDKQVDGLIIAPAPGDHSYLRSLIDDGYPVVVVNRAISELNTPAITTDNEQSTYLATKHMIEHGHSRIAALLCLEGSQLAKERREGYERALREHSLPIEESLMADGLSTLEGGLEATKRLLMSANPPTALVSLSTLMTIGVLRALKVLGVRCPEDLALIGFSETLWSSVTDPPLTDLAQPAGEMGASAVEMLEKLIVAQSPGQPETRVMPCHLIVRRSCGCS